ncbi:MAG: hypothetical protein OXN17_18340 [Candidatus Poribacteria bacterium]|nr:hypothetical protein [Candidatus Poribacteria bacterium]MDE0502677.1 hypothetical protein [Candidatus Poribacteria bacterium]
MECTKAKHSNEQSESRPVHEDIVKKMHAIFDMEPDQRTRDVIGAMLITEMSKGNPLDKTQLVHRVMACLHSVFPLLLRTPDENNLDDNPYPRLPSDKEELQIMGKLLSEHIYEQVVQPYLEHATRQGETRTER